MVIYWRTPVDAQGKVGEGCPLWEKKIVGKRDPEGRPLLFVSPHLCLICPYRGKECKEPLWFPELKEMKKRDLKLEIYSRLKGGKR